VRHTLAWRGVCGTAGRVAEADASTVVQSVEAFALRRTLPEACAVFADRAWTRCHAHAAAMVARPRQKAHADGDASHASQPVHSPEGTAEKRERSMDPAHRFALVWPTSSRLQAVGIADPGNPNCETLREVGGRPAGLVSRGRPCIRFSARRDGRTRRAIAAKRRAGRSGRFRTGSSCGRLRPDAARQPHRRRPSPSVAASTHGHVEALRVEGE
jgi:hypothetical protein